MDAKPVEHGGQVYRVARELGLPLEDILDFSANINPLGPPSSVRRALLEALDDVRFYPDATHDVAKRAIADRDGVARETVLIGNGATEIIDMVCRYVAPRRIWIMEPAFGEYRAAAQRNRVPVVSVQLLPPSFDPPWDDIRRNARAGDLVVWNNPHNPSGRHFVRREFSPFLQELSHRGVFVLVDESFIDFLPHDQDASAITDAVQPTSGIVVVRSLTKIFAIPGLRLGYAIADPSWVRGVEQIRDRWSVSHLAQVSASVGLKDRAFAEQTLAWLHQAHQQIQTTWNAPSLLHRHPTSVNFFLVRWVSEELSQKLQGALLQRGIMVRLCADFKGLGVHYWRVAIRTQEENARLYGALQEALREVGA